MIEINSESEIKSELSQTSIPARIEITLDRIRMHVKDLDKGEPDDNRGLHVGELRRIEMALNKLIEIEIPQLDIS